MLTKHQDNKIIQLLRSEVVMDGLDTIVMLTNEAVNSGAETEARIMHPFAVQANIIMLNVDLEYTTNLSQALGERNSFNILADLKVEKKSAQESLVMTQQVIRAFLQVNERWLEDEVAGPKLKKMAESLVPLKQMQQEVDEFVRAEKLYAKAVQLYQEKPQQQSNLQHAILLHEEALRIFQRQFPEKHIFIGLCHYSAGLCYMVLKDFPMAEEYFLKAQPIFMANYKLDHKLVKNVKSKLEKCQSETQSNQSIKPELDFNWQSYVDSIEEEIANYSPSMESTPSDVLYQTLQDYWSALQKEMRFIKHEQTATETIRQSAQKISKVIDQSVEADINDVKRGVRSISNERHEAYDYLSEMNSKLIKLLEKLNQATNKEFSLEEQDLYKGDLLLQRFERKLQGLVKAEDLELKREGLENFNEELVVEIGRWEKEKSRLALATQVMSKSINTMSEVMSKFGLLAENAFKSLHLQNKVDLKMNLYKLTKAGTTLDNLMNLHDRCNEILNEQCSGRLRL